MLTRSLGLRAAAVVAALVSPLIGNAAPIAYDFYVVTSGKLGNWSFTNALVQFHVRSDTSMVQVLDIPTYCDTCFQHILLNPYGTFSVKISSAGVTRSATFTPNQLYTSIDTTGGGVGIGSYDAAHNFLPAYPIGIQDGIPDCIIGDGDCVTPSAATSALTPDLVSSMTMSGRAWSDNCFNSSNCIGTSPPLHTNRGNFVIYGPYTIDSSSDPLHPGGDPLIAGMFRSVLGADHEGDSEGAGDSGKAGERSGIVYHGMVITDVSVGSRLYHFAAVRIDLPSETGGVFAMKGPGARGYENHKGRATITIDTGSRTLVAHLPAGEIYARFDVANGNAGFGSGVGGPAYPLVVGPANGHSGGNESVTAVATLTRDPSMANYWSPLTLSLVTDFTRTTELSGAALSCVAFDPILASCSDATAPALSSDIGPITLYSPYVDSGLNAALEPYSLNWGVFWAERVTPDDASPPR